MIGNFLTITLILFLVLLSACDSPDSNGQTKTEWNDSETYLASLEMNPWQFGDGLACDTPLPEWHHCNVPTIIGQEHIRQKLHNNINCQSEERQGLIAVILTKNPYACEPEVLEGYEEAVVQHLTPRLEAMRNIQGNQVPVLTEDQLIECSIDKAELLNKLPIVYEFEARICTWRLNSRR